MNKELIALVVSGIGKVASEYIRYRPVKLDNQPTAMKPTEVIRFEATAKPGPSAPTKEVINRGVSTADTIAYQKKQLVRQISLMEMHLTQGCKIEVNGTPKACDCCEKHPEVIAALAEETLGMTGDKIYQEVIDWCRFLEPRTTADSSASGQYDKEYPLYALEGRRLRKAIMGSAIIPPSPIETDTTQPKSEIDTVKDMANKVRSGEMTREEAGNKIREILKQHSSSG